MTVKLVVTVALTDISLLPELLGLAIQRAPAPVVALFPNEECAKEFALERVAPIDMAAYCGDDYSRDGCRVAIGVHTWGYSWQVFAPNGAWVETYGAYSAEQLLGMLREWLAGKAPSRVTPPSPDRA